MPTCRASKQSEIDPIIRWRSYIDSLCWAKGSLNDSSYLAFLRAGSLGVDAQSVFDEVARRIEQAGDFVREAKLRSQIDRAYNFAGRQGTETVSELRHEWTGPRPIKPEFDPLKAEHFARCLPEEIDFDWLKSRSPEPLTNLSPGDFLSLLYAAGEQVLIFNQYRSQGQCVWQPGMDFKDFVHGAKEGVWFLSNPVDGLWRDVERLCTDFNPRGRTRRAEENITAWRYAVLECDQKPKEKWLPIWLAILVQLPFPIVSIVTSGGKSIHALLQVAQTSKADWDALVRGKILPRLVPLGADPGALTAVRLTRLPGCYRGQELQELLYLNPTPDGTPIYQQREYQ